MMVIGVIGVVGIFQVTEKMRGTKGSPERHRY